MGGTQQTVGFFIVIVRFSIMEHYLPNPVRSLAFWGRLGHT